MSKRLKRNFRVEKNANYSETRLSRTLILLSFHCNSPESCQIQTILNSGLSIRFDKFTTLTVKPR